MRYYDTELTPLTGKTFLNQNKEGTLIPQNDDRVKVYFEPVDLSIYERYFDEGGFPKVREIPPKSTDELFEEEMAKLNEDYDAGMLSLANEYNIAVARDGSVETEKVTAVRAKIGAMDNQYEIDQISLFNKYFGE